MTADARPVPLVILGVDAGDPGFIRRWAQEGYLPTVASVMERGWWGRTAGPELISEHGVWVSLFSGVSRSEHGYYYFRQLAPGTYDLETVTGRQVSVPPFWSSLQGQKTRLAIIDVPDSRPLRGLAGLQLANWATFGNWDPHRYPTASEPPELLREIRREFGRKLVVPEKHESTLEEDLQIYRQLLSQIRKKGMLCRHLLARDSFDLIVIVFSQSHAANHQFWKYCPRLTGSRHVGQDRLAYAIRNVYQAIDCEMGQLLAQLPSESNVFIVSSIGMEDNYPTTGLVEAFCRQLGYQAPPESGDASLRAMDLVRRVVPEGWRIALSRHLPRERREWLLADQFRNGTNWRKTTAFSIPASYTSFIRVNLRGREPKGIVEPGTEYQALLDHIEADLRQLIDPLDDTPAVIRVAKTVELFNCDPPESLPDLFAAWKPGRFMERVLHPRAELAQQKPDFYRRSDHSAHGFVAACGPSIRQRGAREDIQVLDLAPAFLSLLGELIPEHMTSRVTNLV